MAAAPQRHGNDPTKKEYGRDYHTITWSGLAEEVEEDAGESGEDGRDGNGPVEEDDPAINSKG